MNLMKTRLDKYLVEQGFVESREKAQRLIRAGDVFVDDLPAYKPSREVSDTASISLKQKPKYVSRGAEKLLGAIQAFNLSLTGCRALDIGASTGGFTDCMLQHGAIEVVALDVGKGQLDWNLRNDERVHVMEGVNARYLKQEDLPFLPDFISMDVSFISLTKILPAAYDVLQEKGEMVTLIKPQFEAGRHQVGKGGVVRDEQVHQEVIEKVRIFGTQTLHLSWEGVCTSPIKGPAGNIEFLAKWKK